MTVRLEPMSPAQYDAWLPSAIEGYARQTSDSGLMRSSPPARAPSSSSRRCCPTASRRRATTCSWPTTTSRSSATCRFGSTTSGERASVCLQRRGGRVPAGPGKRARDHDGRRGLRPPARRRRDGAEPLRAGRRRAIPLRQARLSRDQCEYAERAHMSVSAGPKLTILTVSGTLEDGPSQGQAPTSARTVHLIA